MTTLCSTDAFVRVAGLNESPLAVTINSTEKSSEGSTVNLLDGDISDELRALYPITIPANSKASVTWDLPIPAHLNGRARSAEDKARHGSWTTERWLDENGLTYKGAGGSAEPNGATCPTTTTSTSTTTTTTTTTTTVPATTSTTSTTKPETQPVQIRPASLYSTSNSQLAARAGDGDPATEFVTQMLDSSPPTWAWLNADLGEDRPVGTHRLDVVCTGGSR